jgi:hypothetical protein
MSERADQWPSPDGATGSEPYRAARRTEPGDVPAFRMSEYLNSPEYHRDRADDLEAGNTEGLPPKEVARLIRWHRMAARAN